MTKAQKKFHAKMMREGEQDKLDHIDELREIDMMLGSGGGSENKHLKKVQKKFSRK